MDLFACIIIYGYIQVPTTLTAVNSSTALAAAMDDLQMHSYKYTQRRTIGGGSMGGAVQ